MTTSKGKEWQVPFGERAGSQKPENEVLEDAATKARKRRIERDEEIEELSHEAKKAELEKKVKKDTAEAEKADSKPQQESPFGIKGQINLGEFDLMERQRQLESELKDARAEAEQAASNQSARADALMERLHAKELELVEVKTQGTLQVMMKALEDMKASTSAKKSFIEQYEEALSVAKALGAYNPEASQDAVVSIELKKLDWEHQLEMKKMEREEKRADREFDLKMKQWDEEREMRKEEIAQKQKRDEMLMRAPETIGRVIAQALMDVDAGGGTPVEREAPPPGRTQEGPPKGYHIEVGKGESGEIECPDCSEPIIVGPTATHGECANCGLRVAVKRVE